MSSNNIFLSISVFLNLVLLALFWATLSNTGKDSADLVQLKSDLQAREQDLKQAQTDMTALKGKMGVQGDLIGTADDQDGDTVLGKMDALIAMSDDGTQSERSVEAAMRKMSSLLSNQRIQLQQRQDQLNAEQLRFNNMVAQKQAEVTEHDEAKLKAEKTLESERKIFSEDIDAKDQIIAAVRNDLNDAQAELERVRVEKDTIIADQNERIARQSANLVRLKREKFEREDLSFEIADGRISYVDNNRKVVSINLGRADGLKPGITFSVYQKDNSGIGRRNTEDIKGKIEVTAILGPHRSEARILDPNQAVKKRTGEADRYTFARRSSYYQSKLLRPIAQGDPIYSPAFSRGSKELFSLVGIIDTDGDGKSDREVVRNLIRAAGAGIDNEIGDDGEALVTSEITHKTRFLVIGDLGDQDKTEDTRKKAAYQKIQAAAERLRQDALDNGIRIVSLRAFLDYLGYQAPASPWRKGENLPTTLSAGAASDGTNGGLGQRQSQGNVSGLYHPEKRRVYNLQDRLGRKGTSGNTSELYKREGTGK